jgi:hypothetical protein
MRKHLVILALICGLTALASAQSNYATSPAGFLTTEGARYVSGNAVNPYLACRNFGAYPEYRTQIMDSTHVGAGLRLISRLDYRLDNPRTFTAAGARTWSKVTLHMGNGDYTKSTTNFSTNFSSTPTQVFSGSVTWNAVTSPPNTIPAPWGAVSFPFKQSWPQINATGTIMDYQFTGGKLATNAKWDENTIQLYALDAAWINIAHSGYQNPYGVGPGCTDSGQTRASDAYLYLQTYSKDSFQHMDSFRLDRGIFNGAKATQHLLFHSLGRANPPIPFPGVSCNGIGLTPALIFLVEFVTTSAGGGWRQIKNIPYAAVPPGVRINFQTAWDDTVSKQLKLARPNSAEMPVQPPGKMATVTKIGTKATTRKQEIQQTPLTRYSY